MGPEGVLNLCPTRASCIQQQRCRTNHPTFRLLATGSGTQTRFLASGHSRLRKETQYSDRSPPVAGEPSKRGFFKFMGVVSIKHTLKFEDNLKETVTYIIDVYYWLHAGRHLGYLGLPTHIIKINFPFKDFSQCGYWKSDNNLCYVACSRFLLHSTTGE